MYLIFGFCIALLILVIVYLSTLESNRHEIKIHKHIPPATFNEKYVNFLSEPQTYESVVNMSKDYKINEFNELNNKYKSELFKLQSIKSHNLHYIEMIEYEDNLSSMNRQLSLMRKTTHTVSPSDIKNAMEYLLSEKKSKHIGEKSDIEKNRRKYNDIITKLKSKKAEIKGRINLKNNNNETVPLIFKSALSDIDEQISKYKTLRDDLEDFHSKVVAKYKLAFQKFDKLNQVSMDMAMLEELDELEIDFNFDKNEFDEIVFNVTQEIQQQCHAIDSGMIAIENQLVDNTAQIKDVTVGEIEENVTRIVKRSLA